MPEARPVSLLPSTSRTPVFPKAQRILRLALSVLLLGSFLPFGEAAARIGAGGPATGFPEAHTVPRLTPRGDCNYDGVPDQGEGCDDGNTVSGDGCSDQCVAESVDCQHDRCTVGSPLGGNCGPCPLAVCQSDAYCCTTSWDAFCVGAVAPVCGESVCTTCGNGDLDDGEECDDDNSTPLDGCGADCSIECGNGRLDPAEDCDDGNRDDGDTCSASCQIEGCDHDVCTPGTPLGAHCGECAAAVCGADAYCCETAWDGFCISAVAELCEAPCQVCGDGNVTGGEECDDGNLDSGDGCSATCQSECGNGTIDGEEQCDDGNRADDDGCNSGCFDECGSGHLFNGEECDDGNTVGGDGCSAFCTQEASSCEHSICQVGSALGGSCGSCALTMCQSDVECCTGEWDYLCVAEVDYICGSDECDGCGNGVREAGEECDDGNTGDDDGCSSNCQTEDVPLVPCQPRYMGGFQSLQGDEFFDVFPLVMTETRMIRLSMTALRGYPAVKAIRVFDDGGQLVGEDVTTIFEEPVLDLTLAPGSYTVRVSGHSAPFFHTVYYDDFLCSATTSTTTTTLPPTGACCQIETCQVTTATECLAAGGGYAGDMTSCQTPGTCPTCGDGIETAPEECDDGNTEDGDGCSAQCTDQTACAHHPCHPGAPLDPACSPCVAQVCKADAFCCTADWDGICASAALSICGTPFCFVCGDGLIVGAEECDDGNTADDDGCSGACLDECGSGILYGVEECDDGNTLDGDGCDSMCVSECGNGQINGEEDCDDGNRSDGDGCSAVCADECGSGSIRGDEECDDGNLTGGDGCSASCSLEVTTCGHGICHVGSALGGNCGECALAICQADTLCCSQSWDALCVFRVDGVCGSNECEGCGNGVLDAGEQCDDANTAAGDGCSASCQEEAVPPLVPCRSRFLASFQDLEGSLFYDDFPLVLTETRTVTVSVEQLRGCNSRPILAILDAQGTVVAMVREPFGQCPSLTETLNAGTYTVRVLSDNGPYSHEVFYADDSCATTTTLPPTTTTLEPTTTTLPPTTTTLPPTTTTLPGAVCGNESIEAPEQCDEGTSNSNAAGTYCSTSCNRTPCGAPTSRNAKPNATDALYVLRTAVGLSTCDLRVCDVNDSGSTTATDSLATLRKAVNSLTVLQCPVEI